MKCLAVLGLHLCACTRRGREFAGAAVQFPDDRRLFSNRSRGWSYLAASGGYKVFRGDLSEQEQQLV